MSELLWPNNSLFMQACACAHTVDIVYSQLQDYLTNFLFGCIVVYGIKEATNWLVSNQARWEQG